MASLGITAMAVTPNRKYLAVAERCDKAGVVSVYDIAMKKRRKMLTTADLGSNEIVHVAFSGDSKLCLTQGGAPEWQLIAWTFDRAAKPIAAVKTTTNGAPVYQSDFCPADASAVCCTGESILKFMRLAENQFRPIALNNQQKREPANYVAHCWLPEERLVAATDQGELLLFENFEFRLALGVPSTNASESAAAKNPQKRLDSIVAYSKGFVCGGRGGSLRIYERSEDVREYFKCLKVFNIDGHLGAITDLAISPSEEVLICATSEAQMFTFTLSNTDILKEDAMNNFEALGTSFHGPSATTGSAEISSMDVCVWKPLVATCGADLTVRIWNYEDRSLELVKRFAEEPHSVSLHPSGLYIIVGFQDKLRLMSLLMDDIRCVKELPVKSCKVCAFAQGGNSFAVANNAVVQIYGTYTCEVTANLRGHNGRIRSLRWSKGDRRLMSVGSDGVVLVWKVREGAKDGEAMVPRCTLYGGAASPDFSRIFCVADDRTIREFLASPAASSNAGGSFGTTKLTTPLTPAAQSSSSSENNTNSNTTSSNATLAMTTSNKAASLAVVSVAKQKLCLEAMGGAVEVAANARVVFVGTNEVGRPGFVAAHVLVSPHRDQTDAWEASEPQRYQCHATGVSALKLSHDGRLLFSGGADGSLCVFEVHDVDARGQVIVRGAVAAARGTNDRDGGAAAEFTEEILVTKSDLEEKSNHMVALRQKVDELVLNNEYQLRLKDMKYKERITEISDKFTSELDSDAARYSHLSEDKRRMEETYEEKLHALEEKQKREFRDLELSYDTKITAEMARYRSLFAERDEQNARWDDENRRLVDEHTRRVAELTAEYDEKIEEEHTVSRHLSEEKDKLMDRSHRTKQFIEEDADGEIEEVKLKYEAKLTAERELTLRLKNENAHMKKRFSALTKDVEDQKEEIRALHDKEKELVEAIKGLEKDILGHKKEIRERDETIVDKDKRIYDLKKKNQELEKFKFVLDYKIKELKRQIEPRETEIADMRKQVEEMDLELEQYHKSNSALDLMIGELRLKMDGLAKEHQQQKNLLHHATSYIGRFRRELHACATHLDVHRDLKPRVVELYKKYVLDEGATAREDRGDGAAAVAAAAAAAAADADEPQVQHEYNRQREHLERNVDALRRKIAKDTKMYLNDHARLVDESTVLVDEMNNLRREAHQLELKQRALETSARAEHAAGANLALHVNKLQARSHRLEQLLDQAHTSAL